MIINNINSINKFHHYFAKNRLVLHIIFWLLFIIFYSFIYGPNYQNFSLKLYHTLLLLPVTIVASYFTMLIMIDNLLLKYKYTVFIITLIISSLLFAFLQLCAYYFFIFPILYPEYDIRIIMNFERFLIELLRLYAIVILASGLKLLRHWNRMKFENNKLSKENLEAELKINKIEKQKLQTELDALKSQLNPHFLFNVLNNIYSNSLLKSDVTPSIVLKLSDLMSYILYDCKTKTVPIQKEIDFLKNYIELEKIRLEDDIDITFEINNIENINIVPLLFVPLIENSFKHGIGSEPQNKWISIKISIDKNIFSFKLKNSKSNDVLYNKSNKGGIGIENVKRRLELLYPEQHSLKIITENDSFEIRITINNFI